MSIYDIIKFVIFFQSSTNPYPEDCQELIIQCYQLYRKLFSRVNRRDYEVDTNPLDLFSIDVLSLPTKISSIEELAQMLNMFIDLQSSEQTNIINIVNFVYYYRINNLKEGGVFWRPISNVLRVYSHENWKYYNQLVKQLELPLNKYINISQ